MALEKCLSAVSVLGIVLVAIALYMTQIGNEFVERPPRRDGKPLELRGSGLPAITNTAGDLSGSVAVPEVGVVSTPQVSQLPHSVNISSSGSAGMGGAGGLRGSAVVPEVGVVSPELLMPSAPPPPLSEPPVSQLPDVSQENGNSRCAQFIAGHCLDKSGSGCRQFVFKRYVPSDWEQYWVQNIHSLSSEQRLTEWPGCVAMRQAADRRMEWTRDLQLRREAATGSVVPPWSNATFSHHLYVDSCTGKELRIPIEPLTGILRHHEACTVDRTTNIAHHKKKVLLSKDYLVTPFKSEIFPKSRETGRTFFFDMGASLYRSGAGGASQSWFIETYQKSGFSFDRILCWEAKVHPPGRIFGDLPLHVLSRTSYYNVPVNAKPGSHFNPWTLMRELVKTNDFVVVKLDIDGAGGVEVELVKQLIADPHLRSLVDEFYWEHHTYRNPMVHLGWKDSGRGQIIEGSYQLFSQLRQLGIRAHSWV